METVTLLCIVGVLIFMLYKYGMKKINHWHERGIKQNNPIPFFGNQLPALLRRVNGLEAIIDFYQPFKNSRIGGIYIFQKPFLIVTDPDLLKQIMVKDAEHFFNRYDWFESGDTLLSKNLATLKDDKWRSMRTVMTTVFTSSKMKDMFNFMRKCGEQSVEHVKQKLSENNIAEVEMKDFFSRYGTDVIGSTAFGLEVDSFKNPKNEFYSAGLSIRDAFKGLNFLKLMIAMGYPKIAKVLNLSFFGKEMNDFFISLVTETIQEREKRNIIRKDVIHVLTEARKGKAVDENGEFVKGKIPDLTDVDIAAQAVVFFFGGFETIAVLLAFTAYELAVNPDIQQKLQEEIDEVIERENGVTYEGVMHHMQYLNMVIHEALRKWPPAGITDRVVSKSYTLPKTDNSSEVELKKGDKIMIPIAGLHYDPEYFPDPYKFDPERFRDEKNTIKPFTFLAFGEGLRHCIGMRYALMEAKTILVALLRKYTIVPIAKSPVPMEITKKKGFMLDSEKGFWFGLKPRN